MRHRTYSRGGSGRNGARRYQFPARKLPGRRPRASASRGLRRAPTASPAARLRPPREAVAEALDYRRRRRVVVASLDLPTLAYQWLAKRARGVELVVVESPDQISVPVEAIARALDDRTALVATSHVYFTSGAIQDIRRVADAARKCGALTLVDAYQSVGQVPVDVKAAGVDFLTAGGLKWLLGGPGIVLLYVRDELAQIGRASCRERV